MSHTTHIQLLAHIEQLGTKAKRLKRLVEGPDANPFGLRDAVKALHAQLRLIEPARQLLDELDVDVTARCTRARAEFWDALREACAARSWSLVGSTDRRLIEQGIFIELSGDTVRVDELSIDVHPWVQAVVGSLGPHVNEIHTWLKRQDQLLDALERAYDNSPGERERPLEAVYQATFLFLQRPGFWKSLRVSQMTSLTRPAFRACLSAAIAAGRRTPKGRLLRFGTSLQGKETWELFSPGEQRVVQVGRIALEGGSL